MGEEKTKKDKESAPVYGCGADIGTMNIVSARRTKQGVETRRIRDVFLDLPRNARKMLRLGKVNFFEREDEILILGDAALETANIFGKEARRPLQNGLIAPGEPEALEVLSLLISNTLGDPLTKDEVCYFSVPAPPADRPDRDIVYHRGVVSRIIEECGYTAMPSNEAMAIIYSETAADGFSGLAISMGSGMCNVALAINTIEGLSFSVARGGDYIDAGAARSVGSTQARICAIKEQGFDLNNPNSREQEAIAFYYRELIQYLLAQVAAEFKKIQGQFTLPRPIPMVIGGGTSLATGVMEFFKDVFEQGRSRFPFEISDIRQAKEPLNVVAHGLLVQAMQEYEEEDGDG